MLTPTACSQNQIPELIPAVLIQASKLRRNGTITHQVFEQQIERLTREELVPRGLSLTMRDLPDGSDRFVLKEIKTGAVRDVIDCGPFQQPMTPPERVFEQLRKNGADASTLQWSKTVAELSRALATDSANPAASSV